MTAAGARAILIIAHADDHGAAAVARAVAARRGHDALWLVSSTELARPHRWTHTVAADGTAGGELVLASGRRIAAGGIGSVLNRIRHLVPPAFMRADAREQDYATAEIQALAMSWLAGLGRPVVHAPGGVGPLPARSRRQWLAAALEAGLPVVRDVAATSLRLLPGSLRPEPAALPGPVDVRERTDGTPWSVLVAGEQVYGAIDAGLADACVALGRATGSALLGLRFAAVGARPRLVDVDPFPPLRDAVSTAAVADLLERLCAVTP